MKVKILKEDYWGDHKEYIGLLRNQKKFSIEDNVFIGWAKDNVFKSKIVGIQMEYNNGNSYYIYKVTVPKGVFNFESDYAELICDRIFTSLEEARESRLKCIEKKYKLEVENINKFFDNHKI